MPPKTTRGGRGRGRGGRGQKGAAASRGGGRGKAGQAKGARGKAKAANSGGKAQNAAAAAAPAPDGAGGRGGRRKTRAADGKGSKGGGRKGGRGKAAAGRAGRRGGRSKATGASAGAEPPDVVEAMRQLELHQQQQQQQPPGRSGGRGKAGGGGKAGGRGRGKAAAGRRRKTDKRKPEQQPATEWHSERGAKKQKRVSDAAFGGAAAGTSPASGSKRPMPPEPWARATHARPSVSQGGSLLGQQQHVQQQQQQQQWNCPFCAVSVQFVSKAVFQDWMCRGFCRDEAECRRVQAEKKNGPGKQSGGAVNGGMDHDGMDAQQQPQQAQQQRPICSSMAAVAGGWPPKLRAFVERSFAACGVESDRRKVELLLRQKIKIATATGSLHTFDWDAEPALGTASPQYSAGTAAMLPAAAPAGQQDVLASWRCLFCEAEVRFSLSFSPPCTAFRRLSLPFTAFLPWFCCRSRMCRPRPRRAGWRRAAARCAPRVRGRTKETTCR